MGIYHWRQNVSSLFLFKFAVQIIIRIRCVLVLVCHNHHHFRRLRHRCHYHEIKLQPVVRALGPTKTAALPTFHALTGADNTGSFSNKGKLTCWSIFNEASEDVIHALSQLGTSDLSCSESQKAVEMFVCQFFLPNTNISTVKALRWWLFKKKQAKSERLPPTLAALH